MWKGSACFICATVKRVFLSSQRSVCLFLAMGEAKCEFFVWPDILHKLEESIRTRENKVWKMWDDVLLCEYEVPEMEDKVRERERQLFRRKIENYYVYTRLSHL